MIDDEPDNSLFEAFGVPPLLDLEGGPPVDEDDVWAFQTQRDLPEEEKRRVAELVASYRAWREAFGRIATAEYHRMRALRPPTAES